MPAPQLGPEPERLRAAYLQLLKLSLCDLTGACTREIRWTSDKRVFWRHLTDAEQVSGRVEGKDWPLDGLTMIGLRRLDDLQACVESVLADGVAGDLIEAGAWRGGASILIRSTLDAWGARDRTLWVADSFQGFPPPQADAPAADREVESDMGRIDYLAPGLAAVKEHFARFGVLHGVRFVPGFFDDTLPALAGRRWALIRLDADTYHATRLTLESLYPGLAAGGYVLIDDYFHPYLPESCRRAVDEFRAEHGITDPIEQADWNGGHWRKSAESDPHDPASHGAVDPASHGAVGTPLTPEDAVAPALAPEDAVAPALAPEDAVAPALAPEDAVAPDSVLPGRELALLPTAPSDHELQLRDEVDALRSQVGTADRGPAPPESLAARLRRLVGGG